MPGVSEQFAHLVQSEHLETIDVLGPTIQFVTPLTEMHAPCIMRGTIPPGVSIPLHSHADSETWFFQELERAGAYRVYDDPADLLKHLDEVGGRR